MPNVECYAGTLPEPRTMRMGRAGRLWPVGSALIISRATVADSRGPADLIPRPSGLDQRG